MKPFWRLVVPLSLFWLETTSCQGDRVGLYDGIPIHQQAFVVLLLNQNSVDLGRRRVDFEGKSFTGRLAAKAGKYQHKYKQCPDCSQRPPILF
jgi:hypothetical protein